MFDSVPLGKSNLFGCACSSSEAAVSRQGIGDDKFQAPVLDQAIEGLQLPGFFASSYCGTTVPRLLFCIKPMGNTILWNYNLQGAV